MQTAGLGGTPCGARRAAPEGVSSAAAAAVAAAAAAVVRPVPGGWRICLSPSVASRVCCLKCLLRSPCVSLCLRLVLGGGVPLPEEEAKGVGARGVS